MKALTARFSGKALRCFHEDENGSGAIETVIVLAIAAVVVVGIFYLWKSADLGGEGGGVEGAITNLVKTLFEGALKSITEYFK